MPKAKSGQYPIIELENMKFRSISGSLMHLSLVSRPDLSHSVILLIRFKTNPDETHRADSCLLTLDKRSWHFIRRDGLNFIGFTDSDHAGDVCGWKSNMCSNLA